jgi:hypothetical protein
MHDHWHIALRRNGEAQRGKAAWLLLTRSHDVHHFAAIASCVNAATNFFSS